MRSTTATRTSTDSAEATPQPPAHRAARHHAGALRRHAPGHHRAPGRLRARARRGARPASPTSRSAAPARDRADIERVVRDFERDGLDGLLVVMLTYGPGMRVARALSHTPAADLPGQRPARPRGHRRVGHGRPDLQPGHPRRAGHRQRDGARRPARSTSSPTTGSADAFAEAVGGWARAAAAVTRWRALKVAVFGYAMNGMGDIRVDVHALLRALGPAGRRARARGAAPRGAGRRATTTCAR